MSATTTVSLTPAARAVLSDLATALARTAQDLYRQGYRAVTTDADSAEVAAETTCRACGHPGMVPSSFRGPDGLLVFFACPDCGSSISV